MQVDGEEHFTIEGSENFAQLPDNPEEREKCGKTAKKTFVAATTALLKAECPPLLRTGNVHRL